MAESALPRASAAHNERMAGRRVLLVGSGAIGTAVAQRLAADGAELVGTYHQDRQRGAQLASQLPQGAWDGEVQLDVTATASLDAALGDGTETTGRVGEQFGAPDTLVITTGHRHKLQMFTEQDPATDRQILETELLGPMDVIRRVLPHMKAQGFGRVVLIGSDSGRAGTLGDAASSAARAGLMGLARSLARETARQDITVNVVSPGPTDTSMLEGMLEAEGLTGKVMSGTIKAVPKGRPADPAEIAEAVAYLVGPVSGFTTGQVLSVSGGLTFS